MPIYLSFNEPVYKGARVYYEDGVCKQFCERRTWVRQVRRAKESPREIA
jgi:hypothetical protein